MNLEKPRAEGTDRPAGPVLVITADSLPLWRRFGPMAWMALQYLALSSHRGEQGWVAPVGIRDVAAGIGVTKDTAAGAVSRVMATGLLSRATVTSPGGRRRSGYVLRLPDTMWLGERADGVDRAEGEQHRCPKGEYTRRTTKPLMRIPHPDTGTNTAHPQATTGNGAKTPLNDSPPRTWDQPALFASETGADAPAPSSTGTGDER